jgi:hypothetical protein
MKDRHATAQKSLDVDTLVHIQNTTLPQETLPHWHLILAAVFCTLTVLLALYIFSSRNSNVLHRAVYAQISPQKKLHPGPQLIPSLLPKTRLPRLIRNHTVAAYALPRKD